MRRSKSGHDSPSLVGWLPNRDLVYRDNFLGNSVTKQKETPFQ